MDDTELIASLTAYHREGALMQDPPGLREAVLVIPSTTPQQGGWLPPFTGRFQSTFSATKFVAAGVIVALFGGFLLATVLPSPPDREAAPGAVATGEPASSADPSPSAPSDSITDVATPLGEVYEATARLIVDPGPNPSFQDVALAQDALIRYAEMTASRPVAEAVIEELGLDESPESLSERISTTTGDETFVLSIVVQDDDPEAARVIAQAFGDEMRDCVRDLVITDEVKQAERAIRENEAAIKRIQQRLTALLRKNNKTKEDRAAILSLQSQLSSIRVDMVYQTRLTENVRNRLLWLEQPTTPKTPASPSVLVDATTDVTERLAELRAATPDGWSLPAVISDAIAEQRFEDVAAAIPAAMDVVRAVATAGQRSKDISAAAQRSEDIPATILAALDAAWAVTAGDAALRSAGVQHLFREPYESADSVATLRALALRVQHDIVGPTWIVAKYDRTPHEGKPTLRKPVKGTTVTAIFHEFETVLGETGAANADGANRYSASYSRSGGGQIDIFDINLSGHVCNSAKQKATPKCVQERAVLMLFEEADSYIVREGDLRLFHGTRPLVLFAREVDEATE